jgi:dolichol-phosphate mannosyltransferase
VRVLVIVPTYNEAENIAALIREVRNLDIDPEILIIDDNSPDGTANIVKTIIMERDPKVHLIERPKKMGLGSAYITGFKWALDRKFDVVVEMDADFSHDPKDIKRLVENLENCDVVIGSRYVKGVSVVNWPISRLLLSYFANLYARVITGVKIRDLTSGVKAIKTECLRLINLDGIKSDGYAFQIELHFNLWFKGFKVCEIPIIFVERRAGKSKLNKGIIWEAFWMVLRLGLRRMFKRV